MLGNSYVFVRPNKKISVSQVTGFKILGRVGTHIFYKFFFLEKNINLCILKGVSPKFKMHKIIFFPRKPEKKSRVSPVNLGSVRLS